jgi:hypothetical protein
MSFDPSLVARRVILGSRQLHRFDQCRIIRVCLRAIDPLREVLIDALLGELHP